MRMREAASSMGSIALSADVGLDVTVGEPAAAAQRLVGDLDAMMRL
jgi:hypothetical protein